MQEIKFKNLNVCALLDFIKESKCGDFPHTYDIDNDYIISKGHPTQKTYVKYVRQNMSDILEWDDKTLKIDIKFPFFKLKHIMCVLEIYKSQKIDLIEGKFLVEHDPTVGGLVGKSLELKHKKLSFKINPAEFTKNIPYMPNNVWQQISSTQDSLVHFVVTQDIADKICDCIDAEGKDANVTTAFRIDISDVITFSSKSDAWSFDYESDFEKSDSFTQGSYLVPKQVFDLMSKNIYDFFISKHPKSDDMFLLLAKKDINDQILVTLSNLKK